MSSVPVHPKIYHITHVRNLAQIIQHGGLWSDAKRIQQGLNCEIVGMSTIKKRRLESLEVTCHPGTTVGEYVPFYLCPRSVMLYVLHMRNHPDLSYRDGQEPIVHLVSDLRSTVRWADANGRPWALSDCNAGASYAEFAASLSQLSRLDWAAIGATDWRSHTVKERKQAEFLLYEWFPWHLVEEIGVLNQSVRAQVDSVIGMTSPRPVVSIQRAWYY